MDVWVVLVFFGMLVGSFSHYALSPTIGYMIGLLMLYPDDTRAVLLVPLYFVSIFIGSLIRQ